MIIIDTSAWIEYFIDSKNADMVERLLNEEETMTPSLVLIELSGKSAKENWDFKKYLSFIKSKSSIIGVNEDIIISCGKIYSEERKQKPSFSMIDATILAIARNKNAKILTKDTHFRDYKEAIMI
ncbi:MAG: PIN domain-containing protein [Nanoarchaeota archaeon]|nr:PIN domain-containing protein [Nanoarchaeota archaeon]